MQFEQENPAMTMAMSYQVTDPEVKSLFAGGPRNVSKLRTMLQEQFIQEEMAKLRSAQDLTVNCFADPKLTFEIVLCIVKLAPGTDEFEAFCFEILANAMYVQKHFAEMRRTVFMATVIGSILAVTPWVLHKIQTLRKA